MKTRLTEFFGIEHPILSAPMALISGGRLAAAVTSSGGLGLIGGGYGDSDWLQREFGLADGERVGCGFITWSLARKPELLDETLERQPATIMLSFGDLQPFAERIHAAGVPLIAQVQKLNHARQALDAGAEILAAQGGEAGGHGMTVRSTFTLVPDVVDLAAERAPDTLVLAAGGVADGRGLAAARVLGADGVLVGTRFWASPEALVSPRAHQRAVGAGGDDTYRTRVYDVVRRLDWPPEYNERALSNPFVDGWHANEAALLSSLPDAVSTFEAAVA
ncbi:MAG: nitronate monooxygenase, partial [Mycobacterium sp.]